MLDCLNRYVRAFASLPDGMAWAEANADRREDITLSIRGGRPAECSSADKTAIYLRASDGQREGAAYTENPDDEPLPLLHRALENARLCGQGGSAPINSGDKADSGSASSADLDAMIHLGAELERAALRPPGTAHVIGLTVRHSSFWRRVVNSRGLDRSHCCSYYFVTLTLDKQRPSGPLPRAKVKACARRLEDIDAAALAAAAAEKADLSDGGGALPRVTLPSGRYDCVLSPAVTCNIMATAWQEFSGSLMASGAAIYRPEAGSPIGGPALSITDAPSAPGWSYDLALDSEGSVNRRKEVVKEGRLLAPLHTLASGGGGNAGRAALLTGVTPVSIVTIPSVLYIEPGAEPPQALLRKMGDGVLLTYSLDVFHSINITSGDFSIPCGGIVIREGKPAGVTAQMTLSGNLRELFGGVCAAGSDLTLDEFEYKNYCFGGPSLLVRGLNLSCMD